MNVKKTIAWVGAVIFAIFALAAFSSGGIGSGIIFLLIAFICSPFRGLLLNLLPDKFRKKGVTIASAVVLSLAAFVGVPTDSMEPVEQATEELAETGVVKDIKTDEVEEPEVADKSIPQEEDEATDVEISDTSPTESETKIDNSKAQTETTRDTSESSSSTTSSETAVAPDTSPNEESATTDSNSAPATTPEGGGGGNASIGTAPKSGVYYIVNATNGKIHRSNCHSLPDNDNQIIFDTKEEVLNAGYSDTCGNCKPW